MKTKTSILLLGALLALAGDTARAAPEVAASALTPDEIRTIDAIAAAELKRFNAPGMVLLLLRGDSVVCRTAYGVANIETGEPMTPELMVSVGSVTKTVTAITALALAAEGKLDLDAPVRTYLPWLPPRLGAVNMVQLLSHTAGLGDQVPLIGPNPIDGSMAPVAKAMNDDSALAPPGTVFAYTNQGYVLAGAVIEAVGGAPYAQVVRKTLLKPLGMTRSTFDPRVAMTYRHAQGHDPSGAQPAVLRPFNSFPHWMPAGELITTVDDLARLARALLADGVLDGKRVLPAGILARMAAPRTRGIGNFGNSRFDYGMGLMLREHHGLRIVEHHGFHLGFGACFCLVPERGLAAIAVGNGRGCFPLRTAQAGLESAAGVTLEWTDATTRPLPPADANAALGRYGNGAPAQTIEIALTDGAVVLRQGKDSYPIAVRDDGVWEIPGYRPFLPLPATPIELLPTEPGKPPTYLRFGWRLFQRMDPASKTP